MPGPISLTTIPFRSWSCPLGSPVHGELVFNRLLESEIVLRNVAAKRDHRFVQEFEDSYFETEQVTRLPAMTFEQRIIVGAQGHGWTGARDRLIEQFARSDCIDISSMNAEADDASTPLVDDYQHPV